MTLVEFYRARLKEVEQTARDAASAPWSADVPGMIHVDARAIAENRHRWGRLGFVASVEREHDRQHIALHDPDRVLRRVAADRLILADHTTPHTVAEDGFCVEEGGECTHAGEGWCNWHGEDDCPTVRALALPYDAHPDYQERWKP